MSASGWSTAAEMESTVLRRPMDRGSLMAAIHGAVPTDPAYVAQRGHGKIYSPAAVVLIRAELRRRNIEVRP